MEEELKETGLINNILAFNTFRMLKKLVHFFSSFMFKSYKAANHEIAICVIKKH